MRFPRVSRISLAALALLAGACSDSPTAPDKSLALDEVLAEMSLPSVFPGGLGQTSSLPAAALVPTGCAYSASIQSFVCLPVTARGITVNQGYTLLAASGNSQPAFDPATTAAVRATLSAVGRTAIDQFTVDTDLQQTMTLSGLLTRTHVLDGTQLMKMLVTGVGQGTQGSTINTLIEGLVLPERGATSPYPRAGSITMSVLEANVPAGTAPMVMRMVFNGTSKVAVTITFQGITERCTIDLAISGRGGSTCF